ncbi:MAG: 3'(2'),5'-bisphosphate nucleotidase CysQ family protein [Pseudolabrys sp.]
MTADRQITPERAKAMLDDLTAQVANAAAIVRSIPYSDAASRRKPDGSPVTAADEASEASLLAAMARLLPQIPVISEEAAKPMTVSELVGSFIVIDPLDGTREYLAGSDEYTVNLAIVSGGVPLLGIIAAPARGLLWRGISGLGAERLSLRHSAAVEPRVIRTRKWPGNGAAAVMSRSHLDRDTEALLARLGTVRRSPSGSAVKFCQIAEGGVDVYPRLSTTCEWDVAAGDALIAAAGGIVTSPQGTALPYGRIAERFRVPAFIAWGDPAKARAFSAQGSVR